MIAFLKRFSEPKSAPRQNIIQLFFCAILLFSTGNTFAQAELMPWGNLTGIRVNGQLMDFKTTLNVIGTGGWSDVKSSGKELQKPKFGRVGNVQTVTTKINGIDFTEIVTDLTRGVVRVTVRSVAQEDVNLTGVFMGVKWNKLEYTGKNFFEVAPLDSAKTVDHKDYTEVFLPIHTGFFEKGVVYEKAFTIRVSGEIDTAAAEINLDASTKGRLFAGVGGNFRLQNSKLDPQVIDYCLANMRVAWGRVEMPWRSWQTALNIDPTAASKNGKLDLHVKKSMQMA
ncbi:MAG: hypothetical protein H7325_00335, partial [Pedobacter sp.]|nr:hypothetical protein [Pedobacter sp.]